MSHEVRIVQLPARRVAALRAHASSAELGEKFAQLFPAVFGHLTEQGVTELGAVCAVYHTMNADQMELSAGIEIGPEVKPTAPLEVVELDAGEAAQVDHFGPYEQLSGAHEAVGPFLSEQGRVPARGPIERYITDPEQEPDASKWLTEVIWPLE